jgi:hypothetical protein
MADAEINIVDQLSKLASLRDSGALSMLEFEVAKAQVLGISPTETAKSAPRTGGSAVGPHVQAPEDNNLKPAEEEGVWNCTGCGQVNGVARATCWVCGGTRDAAQARPWEEADGRVIGLASTPATTSTAGVSRPQSPPRQHYAPPTEADRLERAAHFIVWCGCRARAVLASGGRVACHHRGGSGRYRCVPALVFRYWPTARHIQPERLSTGCRREFQC